MGNYLSIEQEAENVLEQLNTGVTNVTGVTPTAGAASSVTADENADVTGVTEPGAAGLMFQFRTKTQVDEATATKKRATQDSPIPGESDRPCYRIFDDWLELSDKTKLRPGVYSFGLKPGKNEEPPTSTQQWICSPLHVDAITSDGNGNSFGRLLRFKNTLSDWRSWGMPMEMLKGYGDELRGLLLDMGVEIDPNAKTLLMQYLQSQHPKRVAQCAAKVGWCGNDAFVLPDTVVGPNKSDVIFQNGEKWSEEYRTAGTLDGWKSEISALAIGNRMLALAISAAFVGPLLEKCHAENGGIHFLGDSSIGKSSLMDGASSVWGGENNMRSWRATSNGIEGATALFNDNLLALDEINQCEPRDIGEIIYMVGNGRIKQRANRTGNARNTPRFRCFMMSNGEKSPETIMESAGIRINAGQMVRLLNIEAKRTYGTWDDLQGMESGAAFSDALKTACKTHYGYAGRAFLEKLTRDSRDFRALLEQYKAMPEFSTTDSEGQVRRGAGRFALLAMAGELATEYGVTGWPKGEATKAAALGFTLWKPQHGTGNNERIKILEQVSGFIDRHSDGRFSDADNHSEMPLIRDRAGWWRDTSEDRTYMFTTGGMKEAVKGFDLKQALDVLQEVGALTDLGYGTERAKNKKIQGKSTKVYTVIYEKLVTPVTAGVTVDVTLQPTAGAAVTAVTPVTSQNDNVQGKKYREVI